MGAAASDRSDQYSLALTVHEVLTGRAYMKGPSLSATMVNQTKVVAPPLAELVPGVPRSLSDAVDRCLAKEPRGRFASCLKFAREALTEIPMASSSLGCAVRGRFATKTPVALKNPGKFVVKTPENRV